MSRVALITGVTGQLGSCLAELLLGKGYVVHGVGLHRPTFMTARVNHLCVDPHNENAQFFLHNGDMTDGANVLRVAQETQPTEIYNLAAQSHARMDREPAEHTASAAGLGALRLLEAMRILGMAETTRFCQASTSELYGRTSELPQSETTPFRPCSPYAVARLYAYWTTVNYREAFGMHASNGILFNHEGPTRDETLVIRKVTSGVAAIEQGIQQKIYLGNLDARRDWGHARDYVEGMWRILQQDEPDDYVLATGESHTVREFVERAFAVVGREIVWRGAGVAETGIDRASGAVLVEIDPRYFRPAEVEVLRGDPTRARERLGWQHRIGFDELVRDMVESDMEIVAREQHRNAG